MKRKGSEERERRKMKNYLRVCALILALGLAIVWAGGCASSQAAKGAGEGAVLGTVGGAVAGAVGALIFGGNVAQGAAAGAAMGAASGAATGAVSGAMADSKIKEQEAKQKQAAELKEKIGDQNFEAANLLAHCKHRQAIGAAQKAYSSTQNPEQRLYALYIQAVAAEESGDGESASKVYAQAVQDDPSRGPVEKVKVKCLEGVMKIQKVRQDYGLPPLCK
jgi:hypothetical protein